MNAKKRLENCFIPCDCVFLYVVNCAVPTETFIVHVGGRRFESTKLMTLIQPVQNSMLAQVHCPHALWCFCSVARRRFYRRNRPRWSSCRTRMDAVISSSYSFFSRQDLLGCCRLIDCEYIRTTTAIILTLFLTRVLFNVAYVPEIVLNLH